MPNPVDDHALLPGPVSLPKDTLEGPKRLPAWFLHIRRGLVAFAIALCLATSLLSWEDVTAFRGAAESMDPLELASSREDLPLQPFQLSDKECWDWTTGDEESQASVSFELSSEASLMLFFSRGPVAGDFNLINSHVRTPTVLVEVTIHYRGGEELERTQVCTVGNETGWGVAFIADEGHDVRLDITVTLPPRYYPSFVTDLPRFSHQVDDFYPGLPIAYFDWFRLKSFDAPMDYGSIMGESVLITTSNAKVTGLFRGFELDVQTSNAPLESIAYMIGSEDGSEAKVNLKTSVGAITAAIGQVSGGWKNTALKADVRTSLGPILLQTHQRTDNGSFSLNASTSMAPVSVYLDSYFFEGSFNLDTSASGTYVEQDSGVSDPWGQGRNRTVTMNHTEGGQHAEGCMYWEGKRPDNANWGEVNVVTSLAPVRLYV
ncbi:hypothetical protein B0H14DRAFT_2979094 [Mycena olivaceomarginata]|nr:hypothetical protein B0H14DRAFT_2979094 [Mycena olivaceomarginata]